MAVCRCCAAAGQLWPSMAQHRHAAMQVNHAIRDYGLGYQFLVYCASGFLCRSITACEWIIQLGLSSPLFSSKSITFTSERSLTWALPLSLPVPAPAHPWNMATCEKCKYGVIYASVKSLTCYRGTEFWPHSTSNWDTDRGVVLMCSAYQAPSSEHDIILLASVPAKMAFLNMLFILKLEDIVSSKVNHTFK